MRREDEPPSAELGAVAEVEILRQRVGLPSAGIHDAFLSEDPRRAVEIEESLPGHPRRVLDEKVAVQEIAWACANAE